MESNNFITLKNRSRLVGNVPLQKIKSEESKISVWNYILGLALALVTAGLIFTFSRTSWRHKQISIKSGKHVAVLYLWEMELFMFILLGSGFGCSIVVRVIVHFLHMQFRSRNRFLYVVHNIQHIAKYNMIAWVIIAAWEILFGKLEILLDSEELKIIDKILITSGILLLILVVKSAFVMFLAAMFYMSAYHEKVLEILFYRYVLEVISGPPLFELNSYMPPDADIGFKDLQKFNPKYLTAWQAKKLIIGNEKFIRSEIKTEIEARTEAEKIFQNVAKPSSEYIDLEALRRFFPNDDALKTLHLFRRTYEANENIRINLLSLQEWIVYSFQRDRCLILSLSDTDAASKTIGTIFSMVFGIFLVAISIPLVGAGGVKYLAVFGINSFIVTYIFGLVWKEFFFAMYLLYVRHPFDVGDEVIIEEIEMYVEKLKVTETEFVGRDKKKYTLSNFGICDKLIMNNSRSELPAWEIDEIV